VLGLAILPGALAIADEAMVQGNECPAAERIQEADPRHPDLEPAVGPRASAGAVNQP
jgi:hypothetical protein